MIHKLLKYFKLNKREKFNWEEINKYCFDINIYFKQNLIFYYENENYDIKILGINYISVDFNGLINEKMNFIININLSRPGLIIGKAGRNLFEIEKQCSKPIEKIIKNKYNINCEISIKLTEYDPLRIIYPKNWETL